MSARWSLEEVAAFVASCDEDEGPEDYDEAAAMFAAVFGRAAEDSDGDRFDLWSHVCAAVAS